MSAEPADVSPSAIRAASALLWIALALQVAMAVAEMAPPDDLALPGVALMLVFNAVFLGITAAATYYFAKGRHWARVTLLVLFLMGVLGLFMLPAIWDDSPLFSGLYVGEIAATAVAMYLAFTQPGASWFRRTGADSALLKAVLPVGRSGWAIAAGYLALFSVLLVPAPFALACGVMAMRDIGRHPDRGGRGRAVFGIVMGVLGTVALVALIGMPLWRQGAS